MKCVSYIGMYLTEDAAKQLVTSCVLSRLDCYNSLLMDSPNPVIQPMKKKSPEYCYTPCSQSTTTSTLHTSATATSLTKSNPKLLARVKCNRRFCLLLSFWTSFTKSNAKLLACVKRSHRFCLILLSFWTSTPWQSFLLSPLFTRHMHAQSTTLELQNPKILLALSHTLVPASGAASLPQDIRHSALFLLKQSPDISLHHIFHLSSTVLHLNQSV